MENVFESFLAPSHYYPIESEQERFEKAINKIPEEVLKEKKDLINYEYMYSVFPRLPKRTIRALADKLNWDWVGTTQELDPVMILTYIDKFKNINEVLSFQLKNKYISVSFIKNCEPVINKIDWKTLDYREMTYEFNEEFKNKIDFSKGLFTIGKNALKYYNQSNTSTNSSSFNL